MCHNKSWCSTCDDAATDLARRLRKEEDEHASEQQLADALDHLEVHASGFVAVKQEAKMGNLPGVDVRSLLC